MWSRHQAMSAHATVCIRDGQLYLDAGCMVLYLPGYTRLFIIDTDTGDIKWAEAGFQAQVADSSAPPCPILLPQQLPSACCFPLLFTFILLLGAFPRQANPKEKSVSHLLRPRTKKGPSASSTRTSGTLPRSCSCLFLSSDVNIAGKSPPELPHQAIAHNLPVQKCLFPTPSLHF